jgi:acetolactate synthase-1/3 small subunit
MNEKRLRTIIVHVEDVPGVLNRVTSLIRRRGYNIASLTVGRTHDPGVSRMTMVVDADPDAARRIEANLYKLVNVLLVDDTTERATCTRELALVKVRADAASRPAVMQVCEVFRARVIDVGPEALICEITGAADKIDGLVDVLRPFGIVEMVRTGAVAMVRSAELNDGPQFASESCSVHLAQPKWELRPPRTRSMRASPQDSLREVVLTTKVEDARAVLSAHPASPSFGRPQDVAERGPGGPSLRSEGGGAPQGQE